MELFTGDRQFPQPVGSFPEPADFTAVIHSPGDQFIADHRLNMPPQKLRPIRSNGRSPVEYTPEFADVVEFLGDQACPINCVSGVYFESEIKAGSAEALGVGGDGDGLGSGHIAPSAAGEDRGPGVETRASEELTGSSSGSDNDDNSSVGIKETANRKRKRKSRRKIELLLESLIFKVMEKQEQMHKQLMETIERNERERIMREEEWKQQEMARMRKDEEARAQEASRSLALISFIQNVLGHEIEIPLPSSGSCMEENGGKDGHDDHLQQENNRTSNPNDNKHPGAQEQANVDQCYAQGKHDQDDINQVGKFNNNGHHNHLQRDINKDCDPQYKRWLQVQEQASGCQSNVLQNHERKDIYHVRSFGSDNCLRIVTNKKYDSKDKRWMGALDQTNDGQSYVQENHDQQGICHGEKFGNDGNVNHLQVNDDPEDRNHDQKFSKNRFDPNSRRWPEAEVQALIMLRSELEHKFRLMGSKCSIWEEISIGMNNMGYCRSAKKCKEKWENMNKYFKKATESGKKQLENSKRCTYFHELEMLYKTGLVNAENPMKYVNHQETG